TVPMRLIAIAEPQDSETGVEQCAVLEAELVAQVWQPRYGVPLRCALLWRQRRDAIIRRVIIVSQKAAGEDIGWREIHLRLGQIATANQMVGISAFRKFRNIDVVVFHLQ